MGIAVVFVVVFVMLVLGSDLAGAVELRTGDILNETWL